MSQAKAATGKKHWRSARTSQGSPLTQYTPPLSAPLGKTRALRNEMGFAAQGEENWQMAAVSPCVMRIDIDIMI